MKSLLFQEGATPFSQPSGCGGIPCRNEVPVTIRKNGRLYKFVLRDQVVPEDAYLPLVKAIAFAIQQNEPYAGKFPERSVRDFMVKNNVVI
jgi:hypothetical protein